MMYDKIIVVGTMTDAPQELYDTNGHKFVSMSLAISTSSDAPQSYWEGVYDVRTSERPVGGTLLVVICREPLLIEKCLRSLHKGDLTCVEGRLVLTSLRCDGDIVPLAELLANEILLLYA